MFILFLYNKADSIVDGGWYYSIDAAKVDGRTWYGGSLDFYIEDTSGTIVFDSQDAA